MTWIALDALATGVERRTVLVYGIGVFAPAIGRGASTGGCVAYQRLRVCTIFRSARARFLIWAAAVVDQATWVLAALVCRFHAVAACGIESRTDYVAAYAGDSIGRRSVGNCARRVLAAHLFGHVTVHPCGGVADDATTCTL